MVDAFFPLLKIGPDRMIDSVDTGDAIGGDGDGDFEIIGVRLESGMLGDSRLTGQQEHQQSTTATYQQSAESVAYYPFLVQVEDQLDISVFAYPGSRTTSDLSTFDHTCYDVGEQRLVGEVMSEVKKRFERSMLERP
jgi:hypothetical protein